MEKNKKENIKENDKENQKNENHNQFFIIIILLIIAISIGYATLSSTLRIAGNGLIGNIRWDVHFENIVEESNKVNIITPATIQGNTTNIEYDVSLLLPGSYYQFNTDIKNGGTIDAKLANMPKLSGISKEQDVYTNYTVMYSDGTPIHAGDVIKAGQSRTITVRVELEKDISANQLPTSQQNLNLSVDLDYIQAE